MLTPLDIMLYFVSPPLLVAGLYAAWLVWREDHSRGGKPHAAE